jgi:hypothetical protein
VSWKELWSCGRAVEVPWVCATQCEMFYCGHTSHLCVRVDVQHSYSCTVWNLQIQHVDTRVGPVRKVSKRGQSHSERSFRLVSDLDWASRLNETVAPKSELCPTKTVSGLGKRAGTAAPMAAKQMQLRISGRRWCRWWRRWAWFSLARPAGE